MSVFLVSASQWSVWASPVVRGKEVMSPYVWHVGMVVWFPQDRFPRSWEVTLWEDREFRLVERPNQL